MKIGLALPAFDAETNAPTSLSRLAEYATRAEQLGYDSVWVMDHFWVQREHGPETGHDPMVALAYLAARVPRLQLGTLVACNSFRHAGQLAREAAALADASGGRFILGLGSGWHEAEYAAFGLPFTEKVGRLEETLQALPGLLKGEQVTIHGRHLHLHGAQVLVSAPPPPIWVAATGPRMLRLTARHAEGWNAAWFGAGPEPFRRHMNDLWAAMDEAGRPRDSIEVSAGLFVVPDDVAEVAKRLLAFKNAGAEHLILTLSTVPFRLDDPKFIELTARAFDTARQ